MKIFKIFVAANLLIFCVIIANLKPISIYKTVESDNPVSGSRANINRNSIGKTTGIPSSSSHLDNNNKYSKNDPDFVNNIASDIANLSKIEDTPSKVTSSN
ncbi:hypothetical protein Syn7502_02527 [Synechococcus sp. PCC 7502]|uniref:hypothetical protein n=1 Tax=Synechococcus sp. PCC 7502 TaxID=1173263 RepID=UPI00029FF719|nr:hypothetical protein [Synechococcus sp. PCC 7502]AFY74499.1 hypothetical protein Syn7502_02527 [Synechococcus sp. PCC 7502]